MTSLLLSVAMVVAADLKTASVCRRTQALQALRHRRHMSRSVLPWQVRRPRVPQHSAHIVQPHLVEHQHHLLRGDHHPTVLDPLRGRRHFGKLIEIITATSSTS
eukprot:3379397-Heterocapsa_arctica.AAC.1